MDRDVLEELHRLRAETLIDAHLINLLTTLVAVLTGNPAKLEADVLANLQAIRDMGDEAFADAAEKRMTMVRGLAERTRAAR